MTNKEAINELEKLVAVEISDSPRLAGENKTRNKALTIAINALKEPKKVKPNITGTRYGGRALVGNCACGQHLNQKSDVFCKRCGAEILWE